MSGTLRGGPQGGSMLAVMEADKENWERAQECFESALKNDQRNAWVLQAYAIMETKRPDGSSRTAIELFERALKVNPRDAGVSLLSPECWRFAIVHGMLAFCYYPRDAGVSL